MTGLAASSAKGGRENVVTALKKVLMSLVDRGTSFRDSLRRHRFERGSRFSKLVIDVVASKMRYGGDQNQGYVYR